MLHAVSFRFAQQSSRACGVCIVNCIYIYLLCTCVCVLCLHDVYSLLGLTCHDDDILNAEPTGSRRMQSGSLVFCRVSAADKDMEAELTCTCE